MKQFILNDKPGKDNIIKLSGENYKYLVKVRRLAVGESFTALLPDGNEVFVKVKSIDKKTIIGVCEKISSSVPCSLTPDPYSLILFQALPKGDKMDLIVRQAAECGIKEIVPFVSEFSVAKKNVGEQKLSRWERIIKEARQQSGSKTITTIQQPLSIKKLFNYWNSININDSKNKPIGLFFHHQKVLEQKSLHEYLNSIDLSKPVVIVIGPEGGFSDEEAELFMINGFLPFTIGDTILRTETAALFCVAAVKIIILEKDSWQLI